MNVKNNIKKISAVLASTALVATTIVGAMAYDLSDYPAPFVEDGMAMGAIVVGANAATQDVIGAIDIAASLQAESVTSAGAAGATTTVVEGAEEIEDVSLGGDSGALRTLDDTELEGFADDEVEVNDNDYDYNEQILIGANALRAQFSGANNWDEDENYGTEPYMEVTENGVEYRILFESPVDQADITEDELEIDFLGREIRIIDFEDGPSDSITVEASNEYFMQEGDSVTVDGRVVTLEKVGENAVLVDVDGQTLSVDADSNGGYDTEEFDQADDFKVEVESSFYIEGATDNSATLKLGNNIQDTYEEGDALEIFDGEDDEDEATWIWTVNVDGSDDLISFGVTNNQRYEKTGVTDPEDRGALAMGEALDFGGYASIMMAGYSEPEMGRMGNFEIDFDNDNKDDADPVSAATPALGSNEYIVFEADDDDDFEITFGDNSVEKAERVFLTHEAAVPHVFFHDGDDEYYAGIYNGTGAVADAVQSIDLVFDDDVLEIVLDDDNNPGNAANLAGIDGTDFLHIDMAGVETITFDIRDEGTLIGWEQFGDLPNDAQSADLAVSGLSRINGGLDETVKTTYGAVIEDPEALLDSDLFSMMIPHDAQQVDFVIQSMGSVVSAGSSDGMAYNVNPIALGLGILDTDAPTLGSKPMIIVGGPAANTVAAEFLGNPTQDEILATFEEGKALIRYDDDNQAMLVAGWGALETQGAANVVSKYDMYDFMGNELEVVVTDLSNIEVMSVN